MKTLLIRVDASSQIGTGHVMRCLALAQAWQDAGGEAVFLMAQSTPELNLRLAVEGFQTIPITTPAGTRADADQCLARCLQLGAELIAVDGYHFAGDYQRRLAQGSARVLAFDDYGHARHYHADFVLNQTNCADSTLYERREAQTQLLLGTSYTLFRREFLTSPDRARNHPEHARRVLVTLGGADPENVTERVVRGLGAQPDGRELEVTVVLGGANRHRERVAQQFCRSRLNGRVLVNVSNMPELMSWAELVVTAGGSSIWELALLGLPCVSIVLAENQRACLEELSANGAVVNLGWHTNIEEAEISQTVYDLLADRARRSELSRRLATYVDGRGVERVLKAVLPLGATSETRKRAA